MKSILEEFVQQGSPEKSGDLLTLLVSQIRPAYSDNLKRAEANLGELIQTLKDHPELGTYLRWHIRNVILQGDIEYVLSDSGVAEGGSFFRNWLPGCGTCCCRNSNGPTIWAISSAKFFYKPGDHYWISGIQDALWVELFELLGIRLQTANRRGAENVRRCFGAFVPHLRQYPRQGVPGLSAVPQTGIIALHTAEQRTEPFPFGI